MRNLEKTLESNVKIRFPDCDPFNHLNNSKYIDYIINSREDQLLENYEFDIYKLALEEGLSWVVSQNQIAYFNPAILMETVTIQTQLIFYDHKTLALEAMMWNKNKTKLKALLWTKFVHYNLNTKKSDTHSEELMNFFEQIVIPQENPISFEERIKNLKKQ